MNNVSRPEELVNRIQGVGRWTLEVVESRMITPRMQQIRLKGSEFEGFDYNPGQDVMLWVPTEAGGMLYRRYTIRRFERETGLLDLNIFAHGRGGPGEHWVNTVQPGDTVDVVGPRGKIALVSAPWHLFVGDETYITATFAMLEALPAGTPAWAVLEVADAQEELPLTANANVQMKWVHRGEAAAGEPTNLLAAIEKAELPASPGHVYIGAELQVARALQRALEARGLDSSQISSKAYWGRGRANASIGEPK